MVVVNPSAADLNSANSEDNELHLLSHSETASLDRLALSN
jgi:hypothetical protein